MELSLTGPGDLAARLYRALKQAVLDGRLREGERLPASRELAADLGIGRNTVTVAYERLAAEGWLSARVGAGTFVAGRTTPRSAPARPREDARSDGEPDVRRFRFDFLVGVPDPALFPYDAWRRLLSREVRLTKVDTPGYRAPEGHPGLRDAIARHVGLARAMRATPAGVLVTQGAQQALDLAARALTRPGEVVAVEDPGYPPARELFESLGAKVARVPVDDEGLSTKDLPDRAKLVYVTPSHQFPLGRPMSLRRREELLTWAAKHDAVIVEDDYDSEFRYEQRPLDPLHSIDHSGRVIYVGSFSKVLSPLLRLGFLVAPPALMPALACAKRLADWHGDWWTQAALAAFIDEGLLARHVRKATKIYRARYDALTSTLVERGFTPMPGAAGLHVAVRVDGDDHEAVDAAARASVRAHPLSRYGGVHHGLVLGFGAIPVEAIPTGIARLTRCL
ncbi:GntR family transcriptional regulator [Actinorhabdospora filicis]|uniref:GntR family transcriptional regulator n=1 Tax=Actinorhabdospora filicis TaxID=1785913 RepID=A0A9W6SPF2_9ACTN|nr:PLP-dependent aminotransferase family protein [Actinorhabdospora filicis]GLZ80579.1 GntR family transcriptional regulator [Actinorhabdospora filicis]